MWDSAKKVTRLMDGQRRTPTAINRRKISFMGTSELMEEEGLFPSGENETDRRCAHHGSQVGDGQQNIQKRDPGSLREADICPSNQLLDRGWRWNQETKMDSQTAVVFARDRRDWPPGGAVFANWRAGIVGAAFHLLSGKFAQNRHCICIGLILGDPVVDGLISGGVQYA
jgi:hypothetical protein